MADLQVENETIGHGRDAFLGNYARNGNTTVRRIMVPFDGYEEVITSILGTTLYDNLNLDRKLTRFLPWRDPATAATDTDQVGVENKGMIATRCEVKGVCYFGQDPANPNPDNQPMVTRSKYEQVEITIFFETVPYPIGVPDENLAGNIGQVPAFEQYRYCSKDVQPGRELLKMKQGGFVFSTPPYKTVTYPIVTQRGYEDIVVCWHDVPRSAFPVTAIQNCFGRVNDTDMVLPPFPPPYRYEPETLLLSSYKIEHMWFPDSVRGVNIYYHFRRRHIPLKQTEADGTTVAGWNHYVRNDGVVTRLYRVGTQPAPAGDGTKVGPFEKADFFPLFLGEPT